MQIRAHIQLPSLRRLRGLVQLLGLVKNDLLEGGEFLGIEEASLMLALHKKHAFCWKRRCTHARASCARKPRVTALKSPPP